MQVSLGHSDLVAEVDDADAELVRPHRWHVLRVGRNVYATAHLPGKPRGLYLHRLVMQARKDQEVDHRDGNGLNNHRANLRIASKAQNQHNRHNTVGASRFVGVSPSKGGRWRAYINLDGRQKHLGVFATEEAASEAHHRAAVEAWGEFAAEPQ